MTTVDHNVLEAVFNLVYESSQDCDNYIYKYNKLVVQSMYNGKIDIENIREKIYSKIADINNYANLYMYCINRFTGKVPNFMRRDVMKGIDMVKSYYQDRKTELSYTQRPNPLTITGNILIRKELLKLH